MDTVVRFPRRNWARGYVRKVSIWNTLEADIDNGKLEKVDLHVYAYSIGPY